MLSRHFLLAAMCLFALAAPARGADEAAEVARLHQAGENAAALERAQAFLATKPRDPQMRFLEAVVLTDLNRRPEATAILEKLVEEYPDLAEPHNNLAVLYAATGNYARARSELEEALRLRPDYAVAHENLGDVYAALAAQSYGTAQRLEPGRATVPAKLALVRQLTTGTRGASVPAPTASAARR